MPEVGFSSRGGDKIAAESARVNRRGVADAQQTRRKLSTVSDTTYRQNITSAKNWEHTAQSIPSRNLMAEQKYQKQLAKRAGGLPRRLGSTAVA